MSREFPTIDGNSNVQSLVDEHFLRPGRHCFVVTENTSVVGLLTRHEVREIERQRWPYSTVDQVMRPLDELKTVSPDTQLLKDFGVMGPEDLNQLPVVRDGSVTGIVSRGHILQLLKTRGELGGRPSKR